MRNYHKAIGFIDEKTGHISRYAHQRHKVGECPWCDYMRAESIAREFLRRMEVLNERMEHLNMWSLGTSLKDSPRNRDLLLRWWAQFRRTIQKRFAWSAVFRVVEVGHRGFLHIHFVCYGYLPHAEVLKVWRAATGEKSNVHVSSQKGAQDVKRLIGYLTKYLTKETTSYRWLGRFHGLSMSRSRSIGSDDVDRPSDRYGGECYFGYWTEGYKKKQRNLASSTPVSQPGEVNENGKQSTKLLNEAEASD